MEYCPFDIGSDPGALGLEKVSVQTHYGSIVSRVSLKRSSETVTIYIHGVGADWTTWTPIIRAEDSCQMKTHDQIFVNLPGFGDSENKLDNLEIADVGAAILSIASSLGYNKVRIVGHSMGGFLTLDMASRYQDRVESIHLVAGPYFSILETIQHPLSSFGHSPAVAATFGAQYLIARTGEVGQDAAKAAYRLGAARLFLSPVASHPFRLKQSVVKVLLYQQNSRGVIQTAANGPGYDADEQWGRIRCPIWATFGDKDRLVPPKDMTRFLRCQPTAKCTMLKDTSHLMHIERPFEVLKALELWPS
jgi:pimeloyl-ACP methyl ester carboxylesterase